MSNFNDLYDHVAADRSRAMQLLGIQDIRRKAVAELLAAGAYTEPDNIDDMTDAEREQHKAEAAYGLGRPHILAAAKMPVQDGDETYAIAVTASPCASRRSSRSSTPPASSTAAPITARACSSWPPTTAPTRTCRA